MLHICLLRALRTKGDVGHTEAWLLDHARVHGFTLLLPELQSELRQLGDKTFIAAFAQDLAAGRWYITALGESKLVVSGN